MWSKKSQPIMIVESMKMEIEIIATACRDCVFYQPIRRQPGECRTVVAGSAGELNQMNLNIASLREAYKNNEITPRSLVETIQTRCAEFADHNIWIHLLSMAELEPYLHQLDKADINDLPLYGIPFAIKDNIDLAGIPTTAACAEYSYIPENVQPLLSNS